MQDDEIWIRRLFFSEVGDAGGYSKLVCLYFA